MNRAAEGVQLVQPDLVALPVTDREWQALAWQRLADVRAKHAGWGLDDALAHGLIGRIVRAYAHQLRNRAAQEAAQALRVQRFGKRAPAWRPVEVRGYAATRPADAIERAPELAP